MNKAIERVSDHIQKFEEEGGTVTAIEIPPGMYRDIVSTVYTGEILHKHETVMGKEVHINPEITDVVVKDFEI